MSKPARRHIAALISRSHLELDRINREVEAGQSVTVSGRVVNHRDVTILVMGPDLEVREASVSTRGDRFESIIPVGEEAGPAYVEILARGPFGPKPLAQLCLSVDEELPWDLATQWPPDESALQSSSQAEAYALELINADRMRFGLAPVVRDPLLDDAAIIHSDDMATGGFFGHHSPNTGSVGDRIASVGARTVFHGENIARNGAFSMLRSA